MLVTEGGDGRGLLCFLLSGGAKAGGKIRSGEGWGFLEVCGALGGGGSHLATYDAR